MDIVDLDENETSVAFSPARPTDRLARTARWLVGLRYEVGVDVPMLAVEQVVAGTTGPVVGHTFDDDASDSLECNLVFHVAADEVIAFCRQLRRAGAGDAVDAVTRPKSQAGQRRAARLERTSPSSDDDDDNEWDT